MKLSRKITYIEAVMMGIGGMFGLAIFVFPGTVAKMIGSWEVLTWPVAGLLMIPVGLIYSELSSAFKVNGGPAVYTRLVFGDSFISKLLSFLTLMGFFVGWTIAIVIGAIAAPMYLSFSFPMLENFYAILPPIMVIAILLISISGYRRASRVNYALTAALLVVTIFYISTISSRGELSNIIPSNSLNISSFFSSIGIVIGAYGAWVGIPSLYKEIRDPERVVPKATAVSIIATAIVYTALVISLHAVVPYSYFLTNPKAQTSPFSFALEILGSNQGIKVIFSMAVFLAIATTMLIGVLSLSASINSGSEQGVIPISISKYDKKLGDKHIISTLIAAIPSVVLSMVPQYFFQLMVIGLVIGTDLPYLINVSSYLYYKYKGMDKIADYKLKHGVFLGLLSFVIIGISALNLSMLELFWSGVTVAILCALFVLREFLSKREKA